MIDVDKAIASAVKTGKVVFGANYATKSAKLGRTRLILVAANCPHNIMDDIKYYAGFSGVPVVIYKGSSIDLGVVCGKRFMISALTIREPGDSEILKLAEETEQAAEESETELTTAEETNA